MKQWNYKIIIFFCLFLVFCFLFFLLPEKISASMFEGFLTVNKTVIYPGDEIIATVVVKVYSPRAPKFYMLKFSDPGGTDMPLLCFFDPSDAAGYSKCSLTLSHGYPMPMHTGGQRTITLSGGTFVRGGGGLAPIDSKTIILESSPAPTILPDIESAIIATTTAEVIRTVTNVLFTVFTGLLLLMIIIGGYFILTAAGRPEQISKGKQVIVYAIIGFVIIILARGILVIIYRILNVDVTVI